MSELAPAGRTKEEEANAQVVKEKTGKLGMQSLVRKGKTKLELNLAREKMINKEVFYWYVT